MLTVDQADARCPALQPFALIVTVIVMIQLCETASIENFDEDCYLIVNPDIAEVAHRSSGFARHHLLTYGLAEGRLQLNKSAMAEVDAMRTEKLRRFGISLPDHTCSFSDFEIRMATSGYPGLPVPYERISAHEYDQEVQEFVDRNPTDHLLDLGAGFRQTYRDNVLYVEIAALPSTDVLSFAEELPFSSSSFDGAVCLAVLEHVPRPWRAVAELLRVVRTGGEIIVDWPFLQPVHGYPYHFFNATEQGARHLFEASGAKVTSSIPPFLHPIFTLRWMLDEWRQGLDGPELSKFLSLTVDEILARSSDDHLQEPWVTALPADNQRIISAGTRLRIVNSDPVKARLERVPRYWKRLRTDVGRRYARSRWAR